MSENKVNFNNNSMIWAYINGPIKKIADNIASQINPWIVLLTPSVLLYLGFVLSEYWAGDLTDSMIQPLIGLCYVITYLISWYYLFVKHHLKPVIEVISGGLNVLNVGLFYLMFSSSFPIQNHVFIVFVSLGLLSMAISYYNQFKTGRLTIPRLGKLEIISIAMLVLLVSNVEAASDYYRLNIGQFILLDLIIMMISVGMLLFILEVLLSTQHVTYGIWLFISALVLITLFGVLTLSMIQVIIIVTLYSVLYSLKLKTATLIDGLERSAGLFTPLVLIVGYFMDSLYPKNTFIIVVAYLSFNLVMFTYRTIWKLRTQTTE